MNEIILPFIFTFLFLSGLHGQSPDVLPVNGEQYCLKSGKSALVVSKNGGRIVSLKFDSTELLTQKHQHENYGSTLWSGPQSNWGWPPYKALDEGLYKVHLSYDSIVLESPPDTVSGFQFTKTISPGTNPNSFIISYSIKNISNKPLKTDAWEVTRVAAGGLSYFKNGEKASVPGSNLDGVSHTDGYTWFRCSLEPFKGGQKMFASASDGWLAHVHKNILFIKTFPDIKPHDLAPQQGEVEIFAEGGRVYIELENHSRYVSLNPGEYFTYQVKWHLTVIQASIKTEPGNAELIEYVTKTLILQP